MLATRNRLRTSADYSTTVRSGVRNGRRNVVLYTAAIAADEPSRIGFIVSKSVGNAVVRNLVKRRLREAGAASLREHSTGFAIVVRALPAAASASWDQLMADYNAALASTVGRLSRLASVADAEGSSGKPPSGRKEPGRTMPGTTQEGTPRA